MGAWRPRWNCVGPGSRLTPGPVLQEEGAAAAGTSQNTTYPNGPSLPVGAVSRPHSFSGLFPSLSLPLWLRVSFP